MFVSNLDAGQLSLCRITAPARPVGPAGNRMRWLAAFGVVAMIAACEPSGAALGVPTTGAEREKYERHKANRQSYMFQGL